MVDPGIEFHRLEMLLERGHLEECQQQAELDTQKYFSDSPSWAAKFRVLTAEAMVWRGMYEVGLRTLSELDFPSDPENRIQTKVIKAIAFTRLQQFNDADRELSSAETLCQSNAYRACGAVIRARGAFAGEQGNFAMARQLYVSSLGFARSHNDYWLQTTALLNLGFVALHENHYDEAVDWSKAAYDAARKLGGESLQQTALGNLGWAYFQLGDANRALGLFLDAEKQAARLGNIRDEANWLATAAHVHEAAGDFARASEYSEKALKLSKRINSKEDVIGSLGDLASFSLEGGRLDKASEYLDEAIPLAKINGNHLDALDLLLVRGMIFGARGNDQEAESIFRNVENDSDSQASMRLVAEHEMAKLYESENKSADAERMYRTTLTTFESSRAQLKNEDSKLPYLANATRIYDDYIHFLVAQGKTDEALQLADQSRARTLAEGLSADNVKSPQQSPALHPNAMARKSDSTLLFYWLGEKQSYLWAVTPAKTTLFPLPPKKEITLKVEHYRKALLGPDNSTDSLHDEGSALYQMLVAPAASLIRPNSNVVILSDGPLSQLNFETLIVPGPTPHYFIEDATITSAPSLHMLASAKSSPTESKKLLLLGDAVSPSPDYPELPEAAIEIQEIRKHFPAANETVFAREKARPAAYLSSAPQQYSYIHFVTHGVASLTDPLDSAIILSRNGTAEESFKLYARDIIQHPIHANLVTISACYGSGTRSYVGEGLVGLSWAFLRAGAHNVIGALWEVDDESTPRLMDALYQGLERGLAPSIALRQAKLSLLHSPAGFHKPYYWAPFQLYTGL